MFLQPFRRETETENFCDHKHTEISAKAVLNRRSGKTAPTAKPALEDYMKIKPGDSHAIIRLKKLDTIDSIGLEKFQEELEAKKKR